MSEFTDKLTEQKLTRRQEAEIKKRHDEIMALLKELLKKDAAQVSVDKLVKQEFDSKDLKSISEAVKLLLTVNEQTQTLGGQFGGIANLLDRLTNRLEKLPDELRREESKDRTDEILSALKSLGETKLELPEFPSSVEAVFDSSDVVKAIGKVENAVLDLLNRPQAVGLGSGSGGDGGGSATEAKQDDIITELQNIDSGKLEEATFTGRVGEVQATPTSNTLLGRLKDIDDALSGTLTVDTEMPAAAALQDGASNPTIPAVGAMTHVYNGTNWDRLRGNTSGLNINDISAGTQTNDIKITLDSEEVTVSATDLDIRALTSTDVVTNEPATTSNSSLSSLASSATSAQALASNANRIGAYFYNTDANDCYLKFGTTATTSIGGFTVIIPENGFYELPQPVYTGRIDAIWGGDGSGGLSITEIT